MKKVIPLIFYFLFILVACNRDRYHTKLPKISVGELKFAPACYPEKPEIPSPAQSKNGRGVVLVKTKNKQYTWLDVTVENGEPFNYKENLYGKGNQLLANVLDFPHFAKTGVHSKNELRNTKMITGRSVSQITIDGRPWGSSGVGFLAEDETILSVIYADNETVKKLKLTHPDIARPLFHFWNLTRDFEKHSLDTISNQKIELESFFYNGHEIQFNIEGSRGWQESVFDDEILGSGHIEIWRELTRHEREFLKNNYSELTSSQLRDLQKMLGHFRTGEMVFFYITRYGFYEGHTEYRVDPVSAALIFGLISIEDAHQACGNLYRYFNSHSTQNPV
jgi:hypothetical protein